MRRQPALRLASKLAWIVALAAILGEAGHHIFERLHEHAAHHLFHILFGGGALVIFVSYLVVSIVRHGWPSFSWRIRPPHRSPARPLLRHVSRPSYRSRS